MKALVKTAKVAFQPKWVSIYIESHCHLAATISTGGAAKLVSVPPIETLTNIRPRLAYLRRVERFWLK